MRAVVLLAVAAVSFASSALAAPDKQKYMQEAPVTMRALVIGVETYKHARKVVNATNDAVGIDKSLKQLGFKTTLVSGADTDRNALLDAISKHVQSVQRDEVSVIFFAGHGIEYGSSNYLVPSDAKNTDILRLSSDNIPVPLILRMIGGRRAGLSLIVLDACRNSPFSLMDENGRSLSPSKGLGMIVAPVSTLIAYAAGPGEVAFSGTEEQGDSFYSRAFLRNIAPNISLETLFKRTRYDVRSATSERQVPWEATSLLGDLFLKPGASVVAEQKQAWETLLDSEPTIELVAKYLAIYPGSPWTASARQWLEDHQEVAPSSGALADANTDAPVTGALVSQTLSFIPVEGRPAELRAMAVATGSLDIIKAKDADGPVVGTLQTGDLVSLLTAPDAQGWAKIQSEQFGEGFVQGVAVDAERAKSTGRNARQIGEIVLDTDSSTQPAQLDGEVKLAWNDLLKRASGRGSPLPVVEISREASEEDVGERRSRQLAFVRYLQARATLLRSGVEKDRVVGELSLATMQPGQESIKVRAMESL